MSYNAVPPPSCLGELESEPREEETELQPLDDSGEPVKQRGRQEEKPANISNDHWKRFQQLKLRRQHESTKSSKQRTKKMRQSALRAVKKAVSLKDVEEVIRHDGVDDPSLRSVEEKPHHRREGSSKPQDPGAWQEIKQYIDPNPQLKTAAAAQHRRPKSGLEKQLEHAVGKARYETAVDISDQLAQRELAQSVVTAIDCYKHVKRQQEQGSEVKSAKKKKLLWQFERKERWETKGNM